MSRQFSQPTRLAILVLIGSLFATLAPVYVCRGFYFLQKGVPHDKRLTAF